MYQKKCILLLTINILCTGTLWFARGSYVQGQEAPRHERIENVRVIMARDKPSYQREISYQALQPKFIIQASEKDIECLMKIVEAEAGGEDRTGKLLVANVVINRVKNKAFPDTITDVVYQKSVTSAQFSPVANGRIDKVVVSEETREAVYSALRGEDASRGALYFMARKYTAPEKIGWFDDNLTLLFSHGGHDFFF